MLLLNPLNMPHFLLNHQLISQKDIVQDKFTIHQLPSRNINYIINKAKPDALFIKQIRTLDAEKIHTLKREATCYWLGSKHPSFKAWKDIMPSYNFYDFNNHILISSFINAVSLDNYIQSKGEDELPVKIATDLAELLSKCHNPSLKSEMQKNYHKYFPTEIPYVLKMASELFSSSWRENEPYRKELIELIQRDKESLTQMKNIIQSWQKTCVIHADIKFQNLLINQQEEIRIIDWETCDIGDPLWDVSAVFHMYLIAWMNYEIKKDHTDRKNVACMLNKDTMQNQIQSFWLEYVRLNKWNKKECEHAINKTMDFCSMKLIHTCFEIINQTKHLDAYITQILQLSLNILKDKDAVIADLLKIDTI